MTQFILQPHSGRITLKILLKKEFNSLFDRIITASSLSEALTLVATETFDLCFLDIELGNKSGFDLIPHLPPETKVIFVTAYSEYAIKAIKEKAFDYLLKPINPAELKTAIKRYEGLYCKCFKKIFINKGPWIYHPGPFG